MKYVVIKNIAKDIAGTILLLKKLRLFNKLLLCCEKIAI